MINYEIRIKIILIFIFLEEIIIIEEHINHE